MNCDIIAEVGWNTLGDMNLAAKMIQEAGANGAKYVKFQTWSPSNLKPGPWDLDGRRQIYESAELKQDQHFTLKYVCESNNVEFLTSCFNHKDADFIRSVCKSVKIPSPEIANIEMLEKIAKAKFEKVFLSTGAAKYQEIIDAVEILKGTKTVLLHCVSAYPCNYNQINLPRINELKKVFECNWYNTKTSFYDQIEFGYSGHGKGIIDAISSLKYRVSVIEKHFTTDNNLPGRDNKFAILPYELKILADYIKYTEDMDLAHSGEYQECEEEVRNVYRGRWQN